jgi:hypothetical protein
MRPLALLIVLALACVGDSAQQDVLAYESAMAGPLQENEALARLFLELASRVKKGETDGPAIADLLAKDLIPAAAKLDAAARALRPATPALADQHAVLVAAWGGRLAAYQAMLAAWEANDLAAFDAASRKNLESKLAEESYFSHVNEVVAPHGVLIDQYP